MLEPRKKRVREKNVLILDGKKNSGGNQKALFGEKRPLLLLIYFNVFITCLKMPKQTTFVSWQVGI